ncbi:hypothetical protein QQF64_019339 [Cirrhinus molitorella]|uniref:Immunoglobulin V-set domain-containing protein n=1 Tax=Cirrhinus molitorella TaxID=172907 RepID=A0ABR3LFB9_9TELE
MTFACAFVLNIWLLVGVFGPQTGGTEKVSVMEGDSVTLDTGRTEILRDDRIRWTFRPDSSNICIAEMIKQVISFPDGIEMFRNRLKMDYKNGSLTIKNITTTHDGFYEVNIGHASKVFTKIFIVNVYGRKLSYVPVRVNTSERFSPSSRLKCVRLCSVINMSNVTLSWYKGNRLFTSVSVSGPISRISLPLEIDCLDDSYSCVKASSVAVPLKL